MELSIQSKYKIINLDKMLAQLGEDETKNILSSFSCPKNKDIETFLKKSSILFSRSGYAKTYLVYCEIEDSAFGKGQKEFVGYYAIAPKTITIKKKGLQGKDSKDIEKRWKKICRFANTKSNEEQCVLTAHLIGQLGKNFANGNNCLIPGKDLLSLALLKVQEAQSISGGKIVYLECEKEEKLLKFYKDNDFVVFGERILDRDETDVRGDSLMQLYQYM